MLFKGFKRLQFACAMLKASANKLTSMDGNMLRSLPFAYARVNHHGKHTRRYFSREFPR